MLCLADGDIIDGTGAVSKWQGKADSSTRSPFKIGDHQLVAR
ncbi:unnamed protein product, partial [marine sediment metagenome]